MVKLDESRPFMPLRIAMLTMSDTRDRADDKSGDTLAAMIGEAGHTLAARDDREGRRHRDPRQGRELDRRRQRSTS